MYHKISILPSVVRDLMRFEPSSIPLPISNQNHSDTYSSTETLPNSTAESVKLYSLASPTMPSADQENDLISNQNDPELLDKAIDEFVFAKSKEEALEHLR